MFKPMVFDWEYIKGYVWPVKSVDMTDLRTVPYHIAVMGLAVVLLEDKIISNSLIDCQDMRVKDFIHMASAKLCPEIYVYAK